LLHILAEACFSYGTPCYPAFDPAFACCPGARESGPAPPNRRASEVRCKTPEINLRRPPLLDLSLPPLARLAIGAGDRQASGTNSPSQHTQRSNGWQGIGYTINNRSQIVGTGANLAGQQHGFLLTPHRQQAINLSTVSNAGHPRDLSEQLWSNLRRALN